MSTQILSNQDIKELQPAHTLWQLYAPENAPYRFQATTAAEALEWQKKTRIASNKRSVFNPCPQAIAR